MLDHQTETPLYHQLADLLRANIRDGIPEPGAELPSEAELASVHGVSKDAVRHALAVLRGEGLLVTRRGYRAIVREAPALRTVGVPMDAVISARMPSLAECHELPDGSPVLVVRIGDQETIYEGRRTLLRWSHDT